MASNDIEVLAAISELHEVTTGLEGKALQDKLRDFVKGLSVETSGKEKGDGFILTR